MFADRYTAAAPTTCGVAIDVPEIVFSEVSLSIHAEVMWLPGAKMSTQEPMLAQFSGCYGQPQSRP